MILHEVNLLEIFLVVMADNKELQETTVEIDETASTIGSTDETATNRENDDKTAQNQRKVHKEKTLKQYF